mmetsp:Transcript_12209/g.15571  ORF Transcript_12209/g.15571 Transcript_12209/m.15571 type:complete len:222 (+) Transcript_12209:620-1285(+)
MQLSASQVCSFTSRTKAVNSYLIGVKNQLFQARGNKRTYCRNTVRPLSLQSAVGHLAILTRRKVIRFTLNPNAQINLTRSLASINFERGFSSQRGRTDVQIMTRRATLRRRFKPSTRRNSSSKRLSLLRKQVLGRSRCPQRLLKMKRKKVRARTELALVELRAPLLRPWLAAETTKRANPHMSIARRLVMLPSTPTFKPKSALSRSTLNNSASLSTVYPAG